MTLHPLRYQVDKVQQGTWPPVDSKLLGDSEHPPVEILRCQIAGVARGASEITETSWKAGRGDLRVKCWRAKNNSFYMQNSARIDIKVLTSYVNDYARGK